MTSRPAHGSGRSPTISASSTGVSVGGTGSSAADGGFEIGGDTVRILPANRCLRGPAYGLESRRWSPPETPSRRRAMSEINNPVPEETPADADQVLSLQELDSEEDEVQAHG